MNNIYKNKKLFISSLLILLMIILGAFLQKNLLYYYQLNDYPRELDKKCHEKKMIWDKSVYLIDKNPSGGKIVLKVENRHKNAWSTSLLPIQSQEDQFKTCIKGVIKYPAEVENSPNVGEEIRQKSKGLEVSIGIQEPFTYTPIAHLTFTMRLFSSKFNDESYNLDVAIQNITDNLYITQEADTSWHLHFNTKWRNHEDEDLPFDYYLVQLNGKEVNQNDSDFISKDNGKTWSPTVKK